MKYVIKYVHTKFEGCLNSFEIGNFIYVIILHKHLAYALAQKMMFLCSKMINHEINHVFSLPSKFFLLILHFKLT